MGVVLCGVTVELKTSFLRPKIATPHKNGKIKDDFFRTTLRFSLEKQYRQRIQGVATTQCWYFKQSMGARNRVGIGLSYRPARLYSLAELVPWNRFLGPLKSLKIRALDEQRCVTTSSNLSVSDVLKNLEGR